MARILTGIQSTGTPHLGNLLGAILPAIDMAKQSSDTTMDEAKPKKGKVVYGNKKKPQQKKADGAESTKEPLLSMAPGS